MEGLSATDWVLIITTITTGICSIIAAIKGTKAAKDSKQSNIKADITTQKIDTVHEITNGNLSRVKEELNEERKRREYLEEIIIELLDSYPSGSLEAVKQKVDRKRAMLGLRRKEDVQSLV